MNKTTNMFLQRAAAGVAALSPYNPGKPLEELEREYGVTNAIKLASNENPLGPSPKALAVLGQHLAGIARYPDDSGFKLKALLADKHAVRSNQVILGSGSSNVLELVVRTFCEPGDEVVYSEHAFAMYPIITRAVGANGVAVPSRDWGHDLDAMARAVSARCKVVFIANPNNPTGTWVEAPALRRFMDAVPDNVLVVMDEAYFEFADFSAGQSIDYPDTSKWLGDYPNLIVTRTFSKAYGLAGLRVGYGICHSQVTDLLNRVRAPFNVNSLGLAAATAALGDPDHIGKTQQVNHDGMRQLAAGMRHMGLTTIPSLANFLCVHLPDTAMTTYDQLLRTGVIVRPRPSAGMEQFLRISVGTAEENGRFLLALQRILGT